MKILVINSGSSSIKYQLFDMTTHSPLTSGIVERIGLEGSRIKHKILTTTPAGEIVRETEIGNHQQGLELVADLLMDEVNGVIAAPDEISAVGHRVVHGGELFSQTTIISQVVKDKVRELIPLAPLHNPANLEGIEVAEKIFSAAPQVAVFDTAFHQTMPPWAYRYALPENLYTEYGVRSYGFHGTSHLYVSKMAATYLGKDSADANLITAHLGNGASITAVKGGQSVDTSMGFSPLPGLMMGTRSGDIDPAIVYFLNTKAGMSPADIDKLLNKESGLKGICGASDLRDIEEREQNGDPAAKLALDMYTYRIRKYIGAYMAALGRLDALVFTAGVGENSPYVRWHACQGLTRLGITLDAVKNDVKAREITEIQTDDSPVKVLVIPTNEELEIAVQSYAVVAG
jgi:acetate kinase